MWWEPSNEVEQELRAAVELLLEQYRSYLATLNNQSDQLIYGIGSHQTGDGTWRPVMLVDVSAFAAGEAFLRSQEASYWETPEQLPAVDVAHLLEDDDGAALGEVLSRWEIPQGTLALVSTRPQPAATVGMAPGVAAGSILRSGSPPYLQATAGLDVNYQNQCGLLSAGHFTSGVGDLINVVSPQGPGMPAQVIPAAAVLEHFDPVSIAPTGGWDIAVIGSGQPWSGPTLPRVGLAAPPVLPSVPANVVAYGGPSQTVYGVVSGGLNQVGDLTRQWLSCWMLAPSGTLAIGDSGSAVLDQAQSVVGTFVGGSMWPGTNSLLHLWVQDLASLIAATNLSITV